MKHFMAAFLFTYLALIPLASSAQGISTSTTDALLEDAIDETSAIASVASVSGSGPIVVLQKRINHPSTNIQHVLQNQRALKPGDTFYAYIYAQSGNGEEWEGATADLSELGFASEVPMPNVGCSSHFKMCDFRSAEFVLPTTIANGVHNTSISLTDVHGQNIVEDIPVVVDSVPPTFTLTPTYDVATLVNGGTTTWSGSIDGTGTNAIVYSFKVELLRSDAETLVWDTDYITGGIEGEQLRVWGNRTITDMPIRMRNIADVVAQYSEITYLRFTISVADEANNRTTKVLPLINIREPQITGASNVLFLPGFMGTRLYTKENGFELLLWEPSNSTNIAKLAMNADGSSKTNIYTGDIIGSLLELPFASSIYGNFMDYLAGLKRDGKINDWKGYGYDWRYDVFDIIRDGSLKKDGSREYLISEVERLAASSKTGKVTLIGHSNGGLLAKALLIKLAQQGKSNLVDDVVLIASPQVGTPQGLFALLHGREIDLGFIIPPDVRRAVALTMPGAYALAPSFAYFSSSTPAIATFQVGSKTDAFRNVYGPSIDSAAEMKSFELNSPVTRTPVASDAGTPMALSPLLVSKVESTHHALDNWTPPAGIEVHEIAGWGQPTMEGASYVTINKPCPENPLFCARPAIEYGPRVTRDGDGTVAVSSGLLKEDGVFFDLNQLNNLFGETRIHKNITESKYLQNYVSNLLSIETSYETRLFTPTKPIAGSASTIIGIHSPANIAAKDSQGRETGIFAYSDPKKDLMYVKEEIPGSSVSLGGEGKYLILPKDESYTLKIDGTGSGTFGLTFADDTGKLFKEFTNLPVSSSTEATIALSGTTVGQMNLDINGDGKTDAKITDKITRKDALAICRKEVGLVRTIIVRLYLELILTNLESQNPDNKKLQNFTKQIQDYVQAQLKNIPQERQVGIATCVAALENSKK